MRSLTSTACAAVLFLVLFLFSAVAWAEAEEEYKLCEGYAYSTEYATAVGTFKVVGAYGAYEAGCGGLNFQLVITPKGKIIRLAPGFRPDGISTLATEGIMVQPSYVQGFTSVGRKVFLVSTFGVWEWVPREEKFGKVLTFSFMVGSKHQTSAGDFYHLLPRDGNSLFKGLLYFEKENGGGGRWILAEYHGWEKSSYPLEVRATKDGNIEILHFGYFHDPWWMVKQQILVETTVYLPMAYSFTPNAPTRAVAARGILSESPEIWEEEEAPMSPCSSSGCELREGNESSFLLGDAVYSAEVREMNQTTGRFTITGCRNPNLFAVDFLFLQTADGEEAVVVNHGKSLFREVPSDEPQFAIINMEAIDDWAFQDGPVTMREIVMSF